MKLQAMSILITLLIIIAFPGTGFCNNPAEDTPWPIGFNTGEMNISRTLMNSYGDLNGSWLYSVFHGGIDIDGTTGYPNCNEVRCVDDGYATIVESNLIPGTDDEYEWLVIICDELDGAVDNGWSYGHLSNPGFSVGAEISGGQLIGYMHDSVSTPHVHFMWTDWDENEWSYCNPLKYLDPSPIFEENYQWIFNPENNDPSFDHFFLEDMSYSAWENLTVVETENLMLDQSCLSGNVDFFFGVSLHGEGMPFGGGVGRDDLTSQKIKYDVVRELATGTEILDTRHVFDFDCELNATPGFDSRAQMLYFRHSMDALFGNDALTYCLTNSNSSEEWDGINNINERYWYTNRMAINALDTENPVLAKYPDGPYSLDVTCYSFDEDYTFPESVPCELHNFAPALMEVSVIDAVTDGIYYHAEWEPDASGFLAVLNVTADQAVPADTELEVILIFTEEMNTGSLSAYLGTSSIGSGEWTSSTVSNDTWAGEVAMPSGGLDETYVLSVSASDNDANGLMDPEGAGTVPGPPSDTHHSLSLGFGCQMDWVSSIHSYMDGSPKLADIDLDGDLDVIVQSEDGWVNILNDDGTSMPGWPVDAGWNTTRHVTASPAIVNLTGSVSSAPEILAVHPDGCSGFLANGSPIPGWLGENNDDIWHLLSSPVAGDLNNDGVNEYVLGRQHVLTVIGEPNLQARNSDGSVFWETTLHYDKSVSGTPSLCDLTGDGFPEILAVADAMSYPSKAERFVSVLFCINGVTGAEEWNSNVGGTFVLGDVTTGNLDDDYQMEIVVGATVGSNAIKILDGSTGIIQEIMPVSGMVNAGASIADIDGDGYDDIVVSSSGGLIYCWGWDGSSIVDLPGFPVTLGTWTDDGVSIGDIDSDGMLELVIAGKNGKLYAINHDGTSTGGFPITVSTANALSGQPALGDIDGDGRLEIIFGEVSNSVIHCYEMGDNSACNNLPWPQFQHDAMNTGCSLTDNTIPEPPTDFEGEGELAGSYYTVDLTWTLSVNDPYSPDAVPPADVVSYQIFRRLWPGPFELITRVVAGTDSYTDVVSMSGFFPVIAYRMSASDGVNESICTSAVKLNPYASDNIASGCPVREIMHSSAIGTAGSHSAIAGGVSVSTASLVETEPGNNCGILTDGDYDGIYIPSGSSDCVEIDLGDVFQVNDLLVIRADLSLTDSPRYELSADGRNFSDINSGTARYVRVYGVAGATEIEVLGNTCETSSAQVEIQRGASGTYRIVSAESGALLTVSVFDLSGRSVWNSASSTGEVLWNRCSSSGSTVPSGIYLIMVESDDMETFTSKVIVR